MSASSISVLDFSKLFVFFLFYQEFLKILKREIAGIKRTVEKGTTTNNYPTVDADPDGGDVEYGDKIVVT